MIAGLAASGITTIEDIYHIERGYADMEGKLRSLGAEITKLPTVRGNDNRKPSDAHAAASAPAEQASRSERSDDKNGHKTDRAARIAVRRNAG